jgi:hypothetical protein
MGFKKSIFFSLKENQLNYKSKIKWFIANFKLHKDVYWKNSILSSGYSNLENLRANSICSLSMYKLNKLKL